MVASAYSESSLRQFFCCVLGVISFRRTFLREVLQLSLFALDSELGEAVGECEQSLYLCLLVGGDVMPAVALVGEAEPGV